MPKKNNVTEEKKTNEFQEFGGTYNGIPLSGKIWPAKETKGIKRSTMHLSITKDFSINATFVETKNNFFIAFPQYETKNKEGKTEYKSYVYVPKDSEMAKALDTLADAIYHMND